ARAGHRGLHLLPDPRPRGRVHPLPPPLLMKKKLTTLGKKRLVIEALDDIKAHDIQAIDVRKVTSIFDWIIVASADSARQSKALARHVRDRLREKGSSI